MCTTQNRIRKQSKLELHHTTALCSFTLMAPIHQQCDLSAGPAGGQGRQGAHNAHASSVRVIRYTVYSETIICVQVAALQSAAACAALSTIWHPSSSGPLAEYPFLRTPFLWQRIDRLYLVPARTGRPNWADVSQIAECSQQPYC